MNNLDSQFVCKEGQSLILSSWRKVLITGKLQVTKVIWHTLTNTSLILCYVTPGQQQVDENGGEVEDSNEGNYCCYDNVFLPSVYYCYQIGATVRSCQPTDII